jgi:U3 small nucleolar RNA-associated protein 18
MVSLASAPRLRKLRRTEVEDVVSGKEYCRRLRKQFELLNPAPAWAQTALQKPARKKRRTSAASVSDDEESGDAMELDGELPSSAPLSQLLQHAESLVRQSGPGAGKKRKIRPEVIDIQRQKDIAGVQPSAITSLSFHPSLPLLLSSGPSSTLYLHQLSPSPPAPSPNPLLTSLHVRGSQLTTTAFHPTDSRIFLSARRRYFHIWNLETGQVEKITRVYGQQHEQKSMEYFKLSPDGRYMALKGSTRSGGGVVNILDATTLQWATQVRVESRGGIADFAWWKDSRGLCVAGKSGEITEWSVVEQSVIARWQDEGAVGTTTLALGGQHEVINGLVGTDRWIAVGSSSGIVNIYDRRAWLGDSPKSAGATSQPVPPAPKPTRMLDHLTTPTSHLAFSHDGQILAMASKWKRDAMRLVHLPSCTVYKNWPTSSTPLGRITGVAFAAGDVVEESGAHSVLAVANEQGKIRLWEIR